MRSWSHNALVGSTLLSTGPAAPRQVRRPALRVGIVLALEERQQFGVDLILMRGCNAVRCTRVVDVLRALDEAGRLHRRVSHWHDLVILPMENQRRYIELLEFLCEIGLGEGLDAFVGVLKSGLHTPDPELVEQALRDLGTWPVGAVKHDCQILVELRAVAHEGCAHAVENLDWQALGIGSGFQHDWRHRGDQDCLRDPRRSMTCDIPRDFSTSGGVAHQCRVVEIERLNDGREIVGVAIHVVSGRGPAGSTMAAPVMRDRAETVLHKEHHLPVPCVGV
jgi:hypothetical protein